MTCLDSDCLAGLSYQLPASRASFGRQPPYPGPSRCRSCCLPSSVNQRFGRDKGHAVSQMSLRCACVYPPSLFVAIVHIVFGMPSLPPIVLLQCFSRSTVFCCCLSRAKVAGSLPGMRASSGWPRGPCHAGFHGPLCEFFFFFLSAGSECVVL